LIHRAAEEPFEIPFSKNLLAPLEGECEQFVEDLQKMFPRDTAALQLSPQIQSCLLESSMKICNLVDLLSIVRIAQMSAE